MQTRKDILEIDRESVIVISKTKLTDGLLHLLGAYFTTSHFPSRRCLDFARIWRATPYHVVIRTLSTFSMNLSKFQVGTVPLHAGVNGG